MKWNHLHVTGTATVISLHTFDLINLLLTSSMIFNNFSVAVTYTPDLFKYHNDITATLKPGVQFDNGESQFVDHTT